MQRSVHLTERRRRIARAVQYLEAHLDSDLTLQILADIACLSRYHFTRIFAEMVGYSPMSLVRHLRMLKATERLRKGSLTIAAAADYAGYNSATAFSRACRRAFGQSPGEVANGRSVDEVLQRRYEIIELDAVPGVGFRFSGSHREACPAFDSLGEAALSSTNWRPRMGVFALDYDGALIARHIDDWVDADVAVPVLDADKPVNGYKAIAIPAGRYAMDSQTARDRSAPQGYEEVLKRVLEDHNLGSLPAPPVRWHRYDPALQPYALHAWRILIPLDERRGSPATAR